MRVMPINVSFKNRVYTSDIVRAFYYVSVANNYIMDLNTQ